MKVSILVVVSKVLGSNKIIWASGIEDGYTDVQVIIPKNLFTDEEILSISSGKTRLPNNIFKNKTDSNFVNLGCSDARHYDGLDFTNFKIEIISKEISCNDFIIGDFDRSQIEKSIIAAFVVFSKKTQELFFAEGTDVDGYAYHQLYVPTSAFSAKDLELVKEHYFNSNIGKESVYLGEAEAKDLYCDKFENLFVGKVYIKVS